MPEVSYSPDGRGWLLAADILGIIAATFLVIATHRPLGIADSLSSSANLSHIILLILFDVTVILRLGFAGQYDQGRRFDHVDDLGIAVRVIIMSAALAVFIAVLSKGFFTGFTDYSRAYVMYAGAVPSVWLFMSRLIGYRNQRRYFAEGRYLARALVIGEGDRAHRFADWLRASPQHGMYGLASNVHDRSSLHEAEAAFVEELRQIRPREVIVALDQPRDDLQEMIVRECAYRGIAVKSLPGVFESPTNAVVAYGGQQVTTLFETSLDRFARRIKSIIDRAGAAVGLAILSPFLLVIALAVWIDDRGSILFGHERVGLHGRSFFAWKFRTMKENSDHLLEECLSSDPAARAQWDEYQKLDRDPRVTRVGRFIRAASIDELPQLINVLLGQMSLVGPRPPVADQLDFYSGKFVFSQVRPGITGLWQISGRNDIDFRGRVDLDVWYIEHWSFWLDLRILLKTVGVVLGRRGAS